MRNRKLSVELVGGLGNQLFCYFAGLAIASKLHVKVEFIHNKLKVTHPQYNSLLSDLLLPIPWAKSMNESSIRFLLRKKSGLVFYKIKCFGKIRDKVWGVYRENKLSINEESLLIFSEFKKQKIRRRLNLVGHFQDLSYFFYIKDQISYGLFSPKNPSKEFFSSLKFTSLQNFSLIHVRRTDFHNNRNTVGVLSEKYYTKAISLLLRSDPNTQIIVVSDDMVEAKHVLPKKYHDQLNFLENVLPDNPAELLVIMSKAKNFVISNSTFSLWSALIAENPGLVIYPKPFNIDTTIKIQNFPNSWLPVPSDFE